MHSTTHPSPPGKPPLSPQALSIWAKSVYQDPQDHSYLQLWQHMEDTGSIATYVWDEFLADDVKRLIALDLGGHGEPSKQAAAIATARNLYRFIATVHDVGKASPAFTVQMPEFADKIRQEGGLRISPAIAGDPLRPKFRHELVGYQALQEWLGAQGMSTDAGSLAHGIASIVAGHHGTSLTDGKTDLLRHPRKAEFIGDSPWRCTRFELLDWAARLTDFPSTLRALGDRPLRRRTQILLTGLIIIADWIASDTRLCPLNANGADEERYNPSRRAARAWRMLKMPKPWTAPTAIVDTDAAFAEQFDIPDARLRPMQREAIRMAQTMPEPGLMIIEANMGEGKTEAALLAAEILAARFHCGGVYYALPTQATVNAMFTRVLDWIGHLPAEDRRTMASLFLAHGKRELNDEYESLREQWFDNGSALDTSFQKPSSGTVFDDDITSKEDTQLQAVVNSWLTGRKRGNLSDFVVGTIDQVLMAGLRCKHVVLRHLSLASKVVILDEIHSNTAYMNVYMETVLSWLGAYGTPVIMLSATLPQERRRAFLEAYRSGANAAHNIEPISQQSSGNSLSLSDWAASRHNRRNAAPNARPRSSSGPESVRLDLRYPLISQATANGVTDSAPEPSGRSLTIQTSLIDDDDDTLVVLLRKQLRDGGCAVVIRDTVSRAQRTYERLSQELDVDVSLSHSRFLAFDRARNDRDLIRRYGKHSIPEQRTGVVVATQVVEQSLDVDFDLMVTDIAPIDLILQRAGRLHRHRRGDGERQRPERLREAKLFITGVMAPDCGRPPVFAKGLEHVYSRYLLMRSLSILGIATADKSDAPNTMRFTIPDDIPRLVQTVYGPSNICPDAWQTDDQHGETAARTELQGQRAHSEDAARQLRILNPQAPKSPFALDGWLAFDLPDPDTPGVSQQQLVSAGVREGDDSFEVIVLQYDRDGNLQLPAWGDFGDSPSLPTGIAAAPDRQQVRDILSCTISLGRSSLHNLNVDDVIEALEAGVPDQWRTYMGQDRELAGQLLVALDERNTARYLVHTKTKDDETMVTKALQFRYSKEKGWEADAE